MSSSMRCRRGVIDAPLQTGLIDSRRVPRSVARSAGQIIEKSGCVVEGRSVALPATAKRFSPIVVIPQDGLLSGCAGVASCAGGAFELGLRFGDGIYV